MESDKNMLNLEQCEYMMSKYEIFVQMFLSLMSLYLLQQFQFQF